MAFKLSDGTLIPTDTAFTIGTGEDAINYPANWLRLSTADEKTALGITEVADPTPIDYNFYNHDGSAKALDDVNSVDSNGDLIKNSDGTQHITYGLKTFYKNKEKSTAQTKLKKYDWYITRKAELGTAVPSEITTYRVAIRTACNTREAEIDACSDVAALITLFGFTEKDGVITPNMTQYPTDPYVQELL